MEAAMADTAMTAIQLETVPTFPFLVGAYIAFFLLLFIYLVTIHARQRRLERDLEALERRAGRPG
jgi:heme exporter protein CcmD